MDDKKFMEQSLVEQKLMEQIKQSADTIEASEGLKPERVEEKLKQVAQKKKRLPVYRIGAAAAVLLVTCLTLWQIPYLQNSGTKQESTKNSVTNQQNISETAEPTDAEQSSERAKSLHAAGILPIDSEEKLYAALSNMVQEKQTVPRLLEEEMLFAENALTGEAALPAEDGADFDRIGENLQQSNEKSDYSQTNLQEMGVDEADLIKTDGQYIYVVSDNRMIIIKAEKGQLEKMAEMHLKDMADIQEMYVDGDTMHLIAVEHKSTMKEEDKENVYYINNEEYTNLYTYDISDRSKPVETGKVSQEGAYQTSRKNGEDIYLFSRYTPLLSSTKEKSQILPRINGENMPVEKIFLPDSQSTMDYLVISSVHSKNPSEIKDQKAIVSGAYLFYVSTENIYICNNSYNNGDFTQIMKFHYKDGMITPTAINTVAGYVNDSFSLNEYQGRLRVVVTEWKQEQEQNHLYVLEEDLKICGSIENLAPGESVQSARFFGDTGYFVTFRQMDPLFSVDLSDPKNPKILGELKITGFSSYLHFYGENRLLGIGNEVDPDTGEYLGIKLSMFDISNPSNVKEEDKYVMKDKYNCPGLYNYKAILVNPEKNILGFESDGTYLVFSYQEEKGFVNEFLYQSTNPESYYGLRGLYIGDTFYLAEHHSMKAFDINADYQKIGELSYGK